VILEQAGDLADGCPAPDADDPAGHDLFGEHGFLPRLLLRMIASPPASLGGVPALARRAGPSPDSPASPSANSSPSGIHRVKNPVISL
jgi:hypothetical protein